ncbi:unnamed protein product [Gulo gulo]|uniref:Uncharacterized protein n=1 Tax=Gulo gulo TaxID=48420 RepID=A0A9X9LKB7_GULGU|nr:unnamed protein product [Gulo gulo]
MHGRAISTADSASKAAEEPTFSVENRGSTCPGFGNTIPATSRASLPGLLERLCARGN